MLANAMSKLQLAAALCCLIMAPCAADELAFPGKDWTAKSPAEVGLDASKLKAFSDQVGGRGCVVRHGFLVHTWGDAAQRGDVASACKPVFAHFLFRAVEDGKLKSLDEKVAEWEPRLGDINKQLNYKDRNITWRQMANQTSCYGVTEAPGTAFCYSDWQMALFFDTLFLKVYGATYDDVDDKVLWPLLAEPMGCQDKPTLMAFGKVDHPGRLAISPRDFARFGLLYLRKGKWRQEQLLGEKYIDMAIGNPLPPSLPRASKHPAAMIPGQRTLGSRILPDNQTEHYGSYSWLWWVNGLDANGDRMFPDAPNDLFGAFGHGGPRAMWVIPSLELVVSYNDAKLEGWVKGRENPTNEAMKLLVEAITSR